MRTVSKVFISLAVVLVLAIAGVFGLAQTYSAKALPRTTVAGIDVSGKTATQIEQQVEAAASERTVDLTIEGQTISTPLADTGFMLTQRRARRWLLSLPPRFGAGLQASCHPTTFLLR